MELLDDSEFAGYFTVFIPDFHAELLQVQHPIVVLSRHQTEQVFIDEPPRYQPGVVFYQVFDSPAHLLVNHGDIGPGVVDAGPGAAAA